MTDHPLKDLRQRINTLDDQILALLGERYALLEDVVAVKAQHNLPSPDPARVTQVIERNIATGERYGLPAETVQRIWEAIIDAAHDYEIPRIAARQKQA